MPPRRDPNKPKGRTSAYAFFVQHRRDEYKREHKPINFAEFSKECADKWKKCSHSDKEHFHKQAESDRERYTREMASYKPSASADGGGRRKRKRKDPNMPKRSM